ncbi:MAG TPA: FHA domain-containing protein, partial [Polyangiaceae bacterium]|nr:FHA domain-containing protein [Polyangiaceae bacterium]
MRALALDGIARRTPASSPGVYPMNSHAFTYVMTGCAPHVPADEAESSLPSVEVRILWASTALQVMHLTPPRSFFVGDASNEEPACDYFVPSEIAGAPRLPIVVARGDVTALLILPRTHGYLDVPGEDRVTLAELVARGGARPSSEVTGAYECDLPLGSAARLQFEGSALVFQVAIVNAGRRFRSGFLAAAEPAALLFTATSFLLHVGAIAALAFFMPKLRADESDAIDRDRILMMKKFLNAAAAREIEEHDSAEASAPSSEPQGGTGAAEKGEAGSMGKRSANDNGHRY